MKEQRRKPLRNPKFDFRPLGKAIKNAREAKGLTREELAEQLNYDARHIQAIENEGQHPSLELLIQIALMFDISIDQYVFTSRTAAKTTLHRQIDSILNSLDDKDLSVVEATAKSLQKAKEQAE